MKRRDGARQRGGTNSYVLTGYASRAAYMTRRPTWSPSAVHDSPDAAAAVAMAWLDAHQRDAIVEIGSIGSDTIDVVRVLGDVGELGPGPESRRARRRRAGAHGVLVILAALAVVVFSAFVAIAGARTIGSTTGFVVLTIVTALTITAALLAYRRRTRQMNTRDAGPGRRRGERR